MIQFIESDTIGLFKPEGLSYEDGDARCLVANHNFWSHLGCSGRHAIMFLAAKGSFRVACEELKNATIPCHFGGFS